MTGAALMEELAAVRAELTRTDAKCSTLAGLTGAAAAFIATQTSKAPLLTRSLLGLAGVLLVTAAIVLLLGVLRPRLGSTGFRRYTHMTAAQIDLHFQQPQSPSEDLRILSTICDAKNRLLRRAVDLTACGVALIGLAVAAGVLR